MSRGQATRERIMDAAKGVFSRHPYNAASIRMIAAEGKFEHGIIRYHFPSKAKLFDAIIQEVCQDIHAYSEIWIGETTTMPPNVGLECYMDHLFAYNEEKPEYLKIIAMNLPQDDSPESIPGYSHIVDMLSSIRQSLEKVFPPATSGDLVLRFQDSFNALALHYLGASYCQARILGLAPMSKEYKDWVKATMVALFSPLLQTIFYGDKKRTE